MFKLKQQPYNLFLIVAAVLFIAGFFNQRSLDIHLHDTYYVFPSRLFDWLVALFLIICWMIYRAIKSLLFSGTLTWLHVVGSVVCLVLILYMDVLAQKYELLAPSPRRYYDYSVANTFHLFTSLEKAVAIFIAGLVLFQLLFAFNILAGLQKSFIKTRQA